jgi:hypothetical protein
MLAYPDIQILSRQLLIPLVQDYYLGQANNCLHVTNGVLVYVRFYLLWLIQVSLSRVALMNSHLPDTDRIFYQALSLFPNITIYANA